MLLLTSCGSSLTSSRGFRLPEGDADHGKTAFVALKCYACHTVNEVELPAPVASGERLVKLGGEVTRVRTYGDLVTSIIHPSYGLSDQFRSEPMADAKLSPMPEFREVMTVAQMIDLVAFLQPRYTIPEPVYGYN
jgi:hypothetical protein